MELRHLRYVVAVADTLHFGQAAKRLNISQPPLSQQIRLLEEEIGVQLFDRSQRQVRLTAAGEMFVAEARMVLAQAHHAAHVGDRMREGEVGQLIIGVAGPADADYFIDIMRTFARRHPQIRVVIRNMSTADQVLAIREKRLHAGFVTPPVDARDLQLDTVLRKPIVLAVPRGHALASRTRVPLSAVAAEPLILFPRGLGPGFFDAIASACRAAGFDLRVKHEVDNLHSAYGLVAAGLGVSFVPADLQGAPPKGVVLKPLAPHLPRVDCELALAYRRDRVCDLVSMFVDVVNDIRRGGSAKKRTSTRTV